KTVWFPKMVKKVKDFIKGCHICQVINASNRPAAGLMKPITSSRPCEKFFLDIFGPLPSSKGCRYGLIVLDHFSRYIWLRGLRRSTAKAIAKELMRIFRDFGKPDELINDNASYFRSKVFRSL